VVPEGVLVNVDETVGVHRLVVLDDSVMLCPLPPASPQQHADQVCTNVDCIQTEPEQQAAALVCQVIDSSCDQHLGSCRVDSAHQEKAQGVPCNASDNPSLEADSSTSNTDINTRLSLGSRVSAETTKFDVIDPISPVSIYVLNNWTN